MRSRVAAHDGVRWLLVAVCGAAGFAVAFVIGRDADPYGPSDWLLAAVLGGGLGLLALGRVALRVRRQRSRP